MRRNCSTAVIEKCFVVDFRDCKANRALGYVEGWGSVTLVECIFYIFGSNMRKIFVTFFSNKMTEERV